MTKQQKKDVRKALRRYGMERAEEKNTAAEWVRAWGTVIRRAMDYYEKADPDCAKLLQLRYIDGLSEWETVGQGDENLTLSPLQSAGAASQRSSPEGRVFSEEMTGKERWNGR